MTSRGWVFRITVLQMMVFGLSTYAFAKKVKLEWNAIEGAIQYELLVQKEGVPVIKRILEDPDWRGELEPGVYSYQVRGVDKAKRPGIWSDFTPLVVMPRSPVPKQPPDGTRIEFYHDHAEISLSWEPVPGAVKYNVQVKKEGKILLKSVTDKNSLILKDVPQGKYSWQVSAVMLARGRSPASLQSRSWETGAEDTSEFKIEYKQLDPPRISGPVGSDSPPEDGKIKLKWKSVDGAQAYEVHLIRIRKGALGRSIASDLEKAKRFVTSDTSLVVRVPGEGGYVWGVRALSDFNENHIAQATGPESVANFSLDRNAEYNEDLGYLAFSTMIAPYTYRISNPNMGVEASTRSSAIVLRGSGELWFMRQWGVSGAIEYALLSATDPSTGSAQGFGRKSFELLGKYRTKLDTGKFGWSIAPKFGFEARDYSEIVPTDPTELSGLNIGNIFILGATAGVDVRKQLNDKISLGLKLSYFYPFSIISGAPGGSKLTGDASYRNFSLGAQGLYWLSSNLGLGVGGFLDMRSISFVNTSSGSSSQTAEQISMDATYFFASIVYRLWK